MSLCTLSVEVWSILSEKLSFWHIMRLYACGSPRVIDIMTKKGGIIEGVMTFIGYDVELAWIPRISEFQNLRRFVYDCSQVSGRTSYFPSKNDLKKLPPSLRYVKLRSDGAYEAFFVEESSNRRRGHSPRVLGSCLDIPQIWPQLEHLDLSQFSTGLEKRVELRPTIFASLPTSVHTITMGDSTKLYPETISALPMQLTRLDAVLCQVKPSSFVHLPRGLEWLSVEVNIKSGHPPVDSLDIEGWKFLPPSLKYLRIPLRIDVKENLISSLPSSLNYLNLGSGISESVFPSIFSTLTNLQGLVINERSGDISQWKTDSPGTTWLKHIPRITRFSHHQPEHFWSCPPNLQWEKVSYEDRFQPNKH